MLYSWTFEKYDCKQIGSGIACSYRVNVITTWNWLTDYSVFVPKFERLFVDLIFIVWLFYFMYWLIRLVKKIFF